MGQKLTQDDFQLKDDKTEEPNLGAGATLAKVTLGGGKTRCLSASFKERVKAAVTNVEEDLARNGGRGRLLLKCVTAVSSKNCAPWLVDESPARVKAEGGRTAAPGAHQPTQVGHGDWTS